VERVAGSCQLFFVIRLDKFTYILGPVSWREREAQPDERLHDYRSVHWGRAGGRDSRSVPVTCTLSLFEASALVRSGVVEEEGQGALSWLACRC
jgi:hypothetical protein